jgi:hypothetical protein
VDIVDDHRRRAGDGRGRCEEGCAGKRGQKGQGLGKIDTSVARHPASVLRDRKGFTMRLWLALICERIIATRGTGPARPHRREIDAYDGRHDGRIGVTSRPPVGQHGDLRLESERTLHHFGNQDIGRRPRRTRPARRVLADHRSNHVREAGALE